MPKTYRSAPVCLTLAALATLGLFAACGGGGGEPGAEPGAAGEAGDAAPAAAEPLGSGVVTGSVTFVGEAPELEPLHMEADPQCAAMHEGEVMSDDLVLGDAGTVANVFVQVLNPPDADHPAPAEPVVLDQIGCRYEPHVVGVLAGQELLIKNSDGILHNVRSQSTENDVFNLAMPPSMTESTKTFSTPEPLFPVKCDVHPWMQAYVAVMDHPYFDVTGEDGHFSLTGLPAGTWEIQAWHEEMGTRARQVTIEEGGTGTVDFEFSWPSAEDGAEEGATGEG